MNRIDPNMPTPFACDDSVETTWRVIDPVLKNIKQAHEHGKRWPSAVAGIAVNAGGRHDPKPEETPSC